MKKVLQLYLKDYIFWSCIFFTSFLFICLFVYIYVVLYLYTKANFANFASL